MCVWLHCVKAVRIRSGFEAARHFAGALRELGFFGQCLSLLANPFKEELRNAAAFIYKAIR